ncbi:major facilitator superfamily domain-containing protein [Dichotomopilus funicola]|uniref:Nitrate/nitrite transporter n=1 Tax=Dichotomopilus funicola TaxID=1934379 RepID=A0AAN6UVV7_9PEZI|nr:major facilitator superfamily domain-containing protein [Dichotomopilus funicola]
MLFHQVSTLWRSPTLNPVNLKARSVPILNPIDRHGRVFFFSWLGFMLAFWAWYAFPPLLSVTIKEDLHLTPAQVANSNIVSLVATLAVRFLAGPLCDQFGPRRVFGMILLVGSLPIGLAPLVKDATGLYISRLFIGILGGSFVPCQVWCTGWFDRNVVGTANALSGGWGNAGGGITYFIMPAVFDSLVSKQGLSHDKAWRVTFVVPLICLLACGLGLLVLCEDTPTGSWNDRFNHATNTDNTDIIVGIPGTLTDRNPSTSGTSTPSDTKKPTDPEKAALDTPSSKPSPPATIIDVTTTPEITTEIVQAPSLKGTLALLFTPHALFHIATYSCSFGGELAINSVLAAYYLANFPSLGQTAAANYAAIFGFLNFIARPLGGVVADVLYRVSGGNLWWKKGWVHLCGLVTGVLLVVIGVVNPKELGEMVGLVTVMAFFLEAGNGANFALVPHVYPQSNGILSGMTGAGGNLGGVVFAIIFRFMDGGVNYAKGFWVVGVIHIALNLAVCWVPPIPKGQVGGR